MKVAIQALTGGLLVVAFACPLAAGPQPAEEKPAVEIKTRAAEITVTIDKELKPVSGLAEDLLAEGQRYVAKSRADADQEYKTNKAWFKDRRWTYDRSYSFRSLVADRYVSILREDGTYGGGAHPNSRTDTILWDKTLTKRISIRPFFTEMADNGPTMTALAKLVRNATALEKNERRRGELSDDEKKKEPKLSIEKLVAGDEQIREAVQPKLLKIGPISLAPSTAAGKSSGLTFHFSPYDVDAYAAGPYAIFVPWTDLKSFLSPEGAAIFGGERPEKDKEL
jgi:hypothetical protein